jgi:hypothetical protein
LQGKGRGTQLQRRELIKVQNKELLDMESLIAIAFVRWIVYSIGSCLVMVIYFMVRIKNLLVAGIGFMLE